jgi:hypothetical protein
VINAGEGAVSHLVPVMAQGGLCRENCCDGKERLHGGNSSSVR